jgi:hypothetical protein
VQKDKNDLADHSFFQIAEGATEGVIAMINAAVKQGKEADFYVSVVGTMMDGSLTNATISIEGLSDVFVAGTSMDLVETNDINSSKKSQKGGSGAVVAVVVVVLLLAGGGGAAFFVTRRGGGGSPGSSGGGGGGSDTFANPLAINDDDVNA